MNLEQDKCSTINNVSHLPNKLNYNIEDFVNSISNKNKK